MATTYRPRRRRAPKKSQPTDPTISIPAPQQSTPVAPAQTSIPIPETNYDHSPQDTVVDISSPERVGEPIRPKPEHSQPREYPVTQTQYGQQDELIVEIQNNEPVEKDVEEFISDPSVETTMQPLVELTVEPLVESTIEPLVESIIEPIVETFVEPIVETIVEPVVESMVKIVDKPAISEIKEDELTMPETLTHLKTSNGNEVYLLGTAHFSKRSVEDVKKLMRTLRPSVVVLELCKERAFMLTLDEQSLLEENRKLSFDMIKNAIATKGLAQGLIYIMFIKMSASLTQKLGSAPGSEFRTGSAEAQLIPGCGVFLGDRPLSITIARAVASITIWQKMKLVYQVLTSDTLITQEDVENCRNKDIIEQLLEELGVQYPGFKRVILDERNVYLAHTIYQWAQRIENSSGPSRIVAIVGIGHVSGIVKNWGKTTDKDLVALHEIPKVSKTRRVVKKTIKYCSIALVLYFGYRVITPSTIQATIHDKIFDRVVSN